MDGNVRLGPPSPPANLYAQGPAAPIPPASYASADASRTLPPVGAPPRVDSPPIGIPVAPGSSTRPLTPFAPQVDSYDEETHICKPNESFRAISQQYYQTDKYDRALLLFNRNHPRAVGSILQDPPALQEGQALYVPPLRVLEKQYAAFVADHGPATPVATTASPAGSNATAPGERQYRVRKSGEMLWEIARRTLGNGDRWPEIYRLNPRFDPKAQVPEGNILRMPVDAQIEPTDVP
jgi:nucleoid-associated protein YgaU